MIQRILVLGGGSAGFLAAITLKVKFPKLDVTVLRSPDIGIIGVGEGTTRTLVTHMHGFLNVDVAEFYREVNPSWKLGVRFLWGPRDSFNYSFNYQIDSQMSGLSKPNGFYCFDDMTDADIASALMDRSKVFLPQPNGGGPIIGQDLAYHLENETFVNYLERLARVVQIKILDDTVTNVVQNEAGVERLELQAGESVSADLFVDSSGFRSVLLGQTLEEPFESFADTLYCDSAVVGGRPRKEGESVKPYTLAETMTSGWCWQIEHENRVNRGYVFSSAFISDADAEAEYRKQNPDVERTRIVRFKTGRYRRCWVKNVVGIGNAAGFVEPLEATALGVICDDASALVYSLRDCEMEPTEVIRREYNDRSRRMWECIRNFLAIHYRFNTRLDTPFWRECREKVALHGAERIVDYYQAHGPAVSYRDLLIDGWDQFRLDGYLTLLVGQKVPHRAKFTPSAEERAVWKQRQARLAAQAETALSVEAAMEMVRSPYWQWRPGFYKAN